MTQNYLEIGKVLSPHGADGMVKVQPWCDSVDVICNLKEVLVGRDPASSEGQADTPSEGASYTKMTITRAFPHKSHVCVKFDGIDTIEQAQKLHGIMLFARREDLPVAEDSYFIVDLIGLPIIDKNSGRIYGKLANINTNTPTHLYEIATEHGTVLLPSVHEFVSDIILGEGIYITPIEGFFE